MGALGYVMHVPEEEKFLQTQAELHDRLVSLLAGRAAEELVFDTVTTGAANDIEQATGIVRNMITRFGMSKKFGLMGLATVESEYLSGGTQLTCADVTAAEIDSEIMEVMKDCYDEAKELLTGNRELMDQLADYLIEKETISGKEFMKIYREAKGLPEPEEKEEGEEYAEKRPSLATKEEKQKEAKPKARKPRTVKPKADETAEEKPAEEKPKAAKPRAVKPKTAKPKTAKPKEEKPKTDEEDVRGAVLDVTIDDDYAKEEKPVASVGRFSRSTVE
jgi:cell division protease FtsH